MRQHWDELCYVHWSYPAETIQALLPPGVTVDTHDGRAWVGLIPFEMRRIAFPPLPPIPWLGSFVEVNVRTYVVDPAGRRAVWFFSLDIPRLAPVAVARAAFDLPYCWASTVHTSSASGRPGDPERSEPGVRHRYTVDRRLPGPRHARGAVEFEIGAPMTEDEQGEFDVWSSARWGLVSAGGGRLRHGQVHHPRWPLHRAELLDVDTGLVTAAGLPEPTVEPVVAYSPGVPVELGWLENARRRPKEAR